MNDSFNKKAAAARAALKQLPRLIDAGDVERTRALVREHGIADALLPGPTGWRPLMRAAQTGNIPLLDMLMQEGARPVPDDIDGLRASFIALAARRHDACLHLLRAEDDFNRARKKAAGPAR